eukprot:1177759-Prorocentrum_minimum.AAC.3
MKGAVVERELGNKEEERKLLRQGLAKCAPPPSAPIANPLSPPSLGDKEEERLTVRCACEVPSA